MFRPASATVIGPKVGCASNGFGFKTPPPLIVPPEEGGLAGAQRIGQFDGGFRAAPRTRTGPGIQTSYLTRQEEYGMYGLRLQGPRRQLGQETAIRFEVKDAALGNFIPNAAVSLVYEDGTNIITKMTDGGGNVAFGQGELQNAIASKGLEGADGVVWYTVQAPGYKMAEEIAFEMGDELRKMFTVSLQAAAPSAQLDPVVVGGVAVAGMLALALL